MKQGSSDSCIWQVSSFAGGELVRRNKLSKATLANRLKDLEVNHRVIRRRVNKKARPLIVEYCISPNEPTEYGKCILELADQLCKFYHVHSKKEVKDNVFKIWSNPFAIRFQEQFNEILDEEMKDLAIWT